MIISISNAAQSTQIFFVIFLLVLLFSFRQKKTAEFFSTALTQELKGMAILAIVFAHIGYYLVDDKNFLFPLTIAAGVGVNMFLFLSGYGLAVSSLRKPLSLKQFYWQRLPKLYLPLWLSCLLFLVLDFFVYGKTYGLTGVVQIFLGYFDRADVFLDLNSPLWYFTFIIFYYLLFPLVFSRRYPWLSATALYAAGYLMYRWDPQPLGQVMRLYQVHILAFPLGVFFAKLPYQAEFAKLGSRLRSLHLVEYQRIIMRVAYWLSIFGLLVLIGSTAYYSHVGDLRWIEETVSLLTMFAVIGLFVLKKVENRLFLIFGAYSYEIYLLHWPILSRFDMFYRLLPAWLATITYLAFFVLSGWLLSSLVRMIFKLSGRRNSQS